jgi:hypothetical protein
MPLSKEKDADKAPAEPAAIPSPADAEEPEKFVPGKDHQSYDTPSGRALSIAGAPNPEDAGSEREQKRGEKYLSEKHKMRWGY